LGPLHEAYQHTHRLLIVRIHQIVDSAFDVITLCVLMNLAITAA
jgi:hypothetical protein